MRLHIQLPYHEDSYTVDTECEEIISALRITYGKFCNTLDCEGLYVYRINRDGEAYKLTYNGHKRNTDTPLQILHNAMFTHKKISPGIFALHAGGVEWGGKAYIFCAATSTGKTTLTAYLTQKGLNYIADDCVFVNMNDLMVYPCHTPIHLRDGGYKVLRDWGVLEDPAFCVDDRYVYMPENLSSMQMEPGGIFFINRTENENVIEMPDKATALKELMLSPITSYPIDKEHITFLNRLTPYCRSIKYSDMDYVLNKILTI